LFKAYVAISYD